MEHREVLKIVLYTRISCLYVQGQRDAVVPIVFSVRPGRSRHGSRDKLPRSIEKLGAFFCRPKTENIEIRGCVVGYCSPEYYSTRILHRHAFITDPGHVCYWPLVVREILLWVARGSYGIINQDTGILLTCCVNFPDNFYVVVLCNFFFASPG